MNLVAIVMSLCLKKESKEILCADRVVLLDDTTFSDEFGNSYSAITDKDENEKVGFIMNLDLLKELYKTTDVEEIKKRYLDDISKYLVINDDNGSINILYVGENKNEILTKEEFTNHFLSHILGKSNEGFDAKELYNELKSKVYCQDEAIKKITTALYLHYKDLDNAQRTNIIIEGDKATGKSTIINVLKDVMPVNVLVEDLGDPNFSFDSLFLGLQNNQDIGNCPILVLDNADKILLNRDTLYAEDTKSNIKKIMLGMDYKLKTESGTINYPTQDFVIILMGDFKKRELCGIGNYAEGVPKELSVLTNYNIKLNPLSRKLVYEKLLNEKYGTISHYANYLNNMGISISINKQIIDKIVDKVLETNMHELDKIVESCFEELIFEACTNPNSYTEASITSRTLSNNKKYVLK